MTKRNKYIRLSLSDSEIEAINAAANEEGLAPATWCRQQTVTSARRVISRADLRQEILKSGIKLGELTND